MRISSSTTVSQTRDRSGKCRYTGRSNDVLWSRGKVKSMYAKKCNVYLLREVGGVIPDHLLLEIREGRCCQAKGVKRMQGEFKDKRTTLNKIREFTLKIKTAYDRVAKKVGDVNLNLKLLIDCLCNRPHIPLLGVKSFSFSSYFYY